MKKIVTISLMAIMLIIMSVTGVKAATNATLSNTLYNMLAKYGMTADQKVKIDRYLADYPVTEEEANAVVAKAQSAVDVMNEAGVTSWNALPADKKSEVRSIAYEAASILDIELVIKNGEADIYKNGKLIESITKDNMSSTSTNAGGKLVYTGNNNIILVVSSIAVIALAFVVARKKLANA